MNATVLLQELEPLTHDARMRRMVEVGQTARTDTTVVETLQALERGGFHERLLALQSCHGSRDAARAMRALTDPSRTLQFRALRLVALCAGDLEAQQALLTARYRQRLVLLRLLRRSRRLQPIDAFLEALAARDPAALVLLLPFGSRTRRREAFHRGASSWAGRSSGGGLSGSTPRLRPASSRPS